MVSLELGFDELEIMKNDSIAKADSIRGPVLSAVPIEKPRPEIKKVTPLVTPAVEQNSSSKAKVGQSSAAKPKASPEAIKKWKAKVAAQKAKPNQAAIDRWKAKVAAQKAAEKKKNAKK